MNNKKLKFILKSTALALVAATIITLLPTGGVGFWAKASSGDNISEGTYIVQELVELRTENSKTYLKSDGSRSTVFSSAPVHYEENGTWKEIDNTFKTTVQNDEEYYQNTSADINVLLPTKLDGKTGLTVEKNGFAVSISPADASSSASVRKIQPDKKSNKSQRNKKSGTELINEIVTTNSVIYDNVYTNTDIQYDVHSNGVKESIILNKKPKKRTEYSYTITADGLLARLNKDKSVDFYYEDGQKDSVVFTMPTPYMFDSKNVCSYNIDVKIEKTTEKTYTLTYIPDYAWLKDNERAYPVIIDPTIERVESTHLRYAYTVSGFPERAFYEARVRIGTFGYPDANSPSDYSGYISAPYFSILGTNNTITSATLSLNYMGSSWNPSEMTIGAFDIRDDYFSIDELTYATRPETSLTPICVNTVGQNENLCFDVTAYVNNWYKYGGSYGIKLSRVDDSDKLMFYDYDSFCYEIEYELVSGAYSTNEEIDMGDAGTVYINNHTGHLKLIREDISVPGNIMPVNISMIYDITKIFDNEKLLQSAAHITSSLFGRAWRLNYSQTIQYVAPTDGAPYYKYVSDDGTEYFFDREENEDSGITYVDTSDSGYTIAVNTSAPNDYTAVTLTDISGQRYYFDSLGRIIKIVSAAEVAKSVTQSSVPSGEETYEPGVIAIKYASTNLAIDTITDGAGRVYRFVYNQEHGLLRAIEYLGYGAVPLKTVTYSMAYRSSAGLEDIIYPDNSTVKYYYTNLIGSNYDEAHRLVAIENSAGHRFEFEYDGYSVTRIADYAPDSTPGDDWTINYGYNETRYYETADYTLGNTQLPYKSMQFNSNGDITGCFVYDKDKNGIYKINVGYKSSTSSSGAPNKILNLNYSDNLSENLLENYNIYNGWTFSSSENEIVSEAGINGSNTICLNGNVNKENTATNIFAVSGAKDQKYTIAFWVMSHIYAHTEHTNLSLDITFLNAEGEEIADSTISVKPNNNVDDWQYVTEVVSCPEDFSSIKLCLSNAKRYPDAYFCDVALYREAYGYNYYYDDNGELDRIEEITSPETEEDETENEGAEDSTDESVDNDTDPFSDTTVSEMGIKTVTKYDAFGNVIESLVTNDVVSVSEKTTYTADGNYVSSTSDALGNSTLYNYNSQLGTLDSVTDANGNTTNYTYDTMGTVTGMSQSVSGLVGGDSLSVTYTYDSGDRVRTINHNNFNYTFNYDSFGVLSSVKAADKTLVSYAYDTDYIPTSTTYGNDQTIYYSYDTKGQLVGISTSPNEIDRCEFAYDHSGNLTMVYDLVNHRRTNLTYDSEGNVYTTVRNTLNGIVKHDYKTIGDVYTETVGNKSFAMTYSYDADGRLTELTWNNGGTAAKKEIYYDNLDRQTGSVISATTGEETVQILNTAYVYNDTVNFGTSNQISTVKNDANGYSSTIVYEYDNNGNITKAGDVSYSYDEAGQLSRVNDPQYGTTVYVYDVGGNIKYVKSYDYSVGALGTCTGTITYDYTDEWKDLLTSYNGQTITYDGAGNPISYRDGMQFTWEMGRQLKTASYNGTTYSYKYNSDGLRTEKTHGTVTTEYLWADGQLTYQYDGTNELYFRYDDSGEAIAFNLNGVDYYYVKNLQGDIIAILDGQGRCVTKYVYDAWGKLLNIEDTSSINLATVNPLRYRGYYYDTELGLYYLQSRYYDPTVGRFLNADSVENLGASEKIASYNLIAYCVNNPLNRNDASGHNSLVISGFAIKYGFSLAGWALTAKITAFVSVVAPYLLAAVAIIVAGYLVYKISQMIIVKSVSKKIPNKLKTKDGRVDLSKFKTKLPGNGGWRGPDGWRIVKDFAKHAGSVWKLLDQAGRRIATLWNDGSIRGK